MAGHSKWANIRFRKGAQDAKRGKLFTKLIREIMVAAREDGGDPTSNSRLRAAINKAKAQSVPKENVDRAIQRGTGELHGVQYEEVRYEGYGPGGAAVMVDCLTDNRNRTVAEVRHAFSKFGGNVGADGSVAYLFVLKGHLTYPSSCDEEKLMEAAVESGAADVVSDADGRVEVLTEPADFETVKRAIDLAGIEFEEAGLSLRASANTFLDASQAETFMNLLDALEELDDVQQVHSNADIPQEVVEHLGAS